MVHPYSGHCGQSCQGPPWGTGQDSQAPQEATGLLLLQPKGQSLCPAHPTEPSSAKLAGALAGVFHTPRGRPSHGEKPRNPSILDSRNTSITWRSGYVFIPLGVLYVTLNLGVVSLNVGLLLRVCWYLACLLHFTSPQPYQALLLRSSWASLCSEKDTHVGWRPYYVPPRGQGLSETCFILSTVLWGTDNSPSLGEKNKTPRPKISHSRSGSEWIRKSFQTTQVNSKVSFLSTVLRSNEKIHLIKKKKSLCTV